MKSISFSKSSSICLGSNVICVIFFNVSTYHYIYEILFVTCVVTMSKRGQYLTGLKQDISDKAPTKSEENEEDDESVQVGDFLYTVLSGDHDLLENFVRSPQFKQAKENKDIHQEIMVALRTAIGKGKLDVVKQLDTLFNLNSPDDKRTPYIAALSGDMDMFHIFSRKDKVLRQKFATHEHPLVAAFKSKNVEMAKWMKEWADENNVSNEIKAEAVNAAAQMGRLENLKLYKVSNPHKASVIANLVKYGHTNLIPHVIHDKDEEGNPINDYSYNNFQMLEAVSSDYDACASMLRHPSLEKHVKNMPVYFQSIYNAEKRLWQDKRDAMINHHKELVANRANSLLGNGASRKASIYASMMEHQPVLLQCLADAGLDGF